MADFPLLNPLRDGYSPQVIDGFEWERMDDGTVSGQSFYIGDHRDITLKYHVDAADRGTLDAFWTANKGTLINLTLDDTNEIIAVYMLGPPKYTLLDTADRRWTAEVKFSI